MDSQYQIDIKKINATFSALADVSEQTALQIADLIVYSQSSITSESVLMDKLQLLESLSELDTDKNGFLLVVLDHLIKSIETYQVSESSSPNQVLADLIKQNGTRQKDLSHIVPQSIISELVNGKRQLNLRHIKAFAEYFNVPVDYFLNRDQ